MSDFAKIVSGISIALVIYFSSLGISWLVKDNIEANKKIDKIYSELIYKK